MREYQGIFKARYTLKGKDWIKALSPEDLQVFIDMGMKAWDYGRMGGQALARKRGSEYMRSIARIGGIVTSSKKLWNRLMIEELERMQS